MDMLPALNISSAPKRYQSVPVVLFGTSLPAYTMLNASLTVENDFMQSNVQEPTKGVSACRGGRACATL
jgi:hypothetical protein